MVVSENKPVKQIAMLALVVGSLCGSALCQYAAEFSSYYSGNRYDFRLTWEQLSNTPAWLEDEPNPPLSLRAAKNAALTYLKTLFDNASAWRVTASATRLPRLYDYAFQRRCDHGRQRNEIKLVPQSERWVYVVSFTETPNTLCR
jgi:hypothetical protein